MSKAKYARFDIIRQLEKNQLCDFANRLSNDTKRFVSKNKNYKPSDGVMSQIIMNAIELKFWWQDLLDLKPILAGELLKKCNFQNSKLTTSQIKEVRRIYVSV